MHEFTISVAEILGRPGERREWSIEKPLDGVAVALARLEPAPIVGSGAVESVVEGVLVTGRLGGVAGAECARCLRALKTAIEVELCELFAAPGHVGEEDGPRIQGDEIDLKPVLHDSFTLALPLKPLCSEDCKGLCATCGADLNETVCECKTDAIDPRWAPLAAIRDQLGG